MSITYPDDVRAAAALLLRERERERTVQLREERRDILGYMSRRFNARIWSPDAPPHDGIFLAPPIAEMLLAVQRYPWVGVQSANSTGKTHALPLIISWFLECFGAEFDNSPSCEVYVTAAPPSRNLNRVWSELQSLRWKYPDVMGDWVTTLGHDKRLYNPQLPGKWFCSALPIPQNKSPEQQAEAFTGKHARYMLFILDDANSIPVPIWKAIEECTTAGVVVRVLFCFNPRQRDSEAYRRASTPGLAHTVRIPAFDHPNVIAGEHIIPGAVTRPAVVLRINQYSRPLSGDEKFRPEDSSHFEIPDFLVNEQAQNPDGTITPPLPPVPRAVTNGSLSVSVLARAPKLGAQQLIPDEWAARARSNYDLYVARHGESPPSSVRPRLSWDVGDTTDPNVLWARWGNFCLRLDKWMGTDFDESEERVARYYKQHNAQLLIIDENGIGAPLPTHMKKRGCHVVGVKVQRKPTQRKIEIVEGRVVEHEFESFGSQLGWAVRLWLDPDINPNAMLPPDDELLAAMGVLVYREIDHGTNVGKFWVTDKDTLKQYVSSGDRSKAMHSADTWEAFKMTFAPSGGGWAIVVQH